MTTERDFWDVIYLDGDYDKDDHFGNWHEDPKHVNEPPHVFVREESINKSSDDMSIPMENPNKEYLMYEKGIGWVIGWASDETMSLHYYCHIDEEVVRFWPSHWLPMPPTPITHSV